MAQFSDNVAIFGARLAANLPQATQASTSALMTLMNAFLSADADTQYLIQQSSAAMFLSTATGSVLDAKAADYNAYRSPGGAASGLVVFTVPQPATSAITIPAGTVVSTTGDGVTTQPITFSTSAAATIAQNAQVSGTVTAAALTNGANTNVAQGAISVMVTQISSGLVGVTNASTYTPPGGSAISTGIASGTTGGADQDSDAVLRSKAIANIATKYGASAIAASILGISGVYDAYVNDPQNGSGQIQYYWCDVNGALTLAPATTVNPAVNAVLPPSITVTTNGIFPSVYVTTALTIKYDADPSVKSTSPTSALNTQIAAAVLSYLQQLVHNQVPTTFGLGAYVNQQVGFVLYNVSVPSLTYSLNGGGGVVVTDLTTLSPSNTAIWRGSSAMTLTFQNY